MYPTRYPIFIISKGRAESRLTSKALEELQVDYKIVVEPQEAEMYAAVIDPAKILVLPEGNQGLGSIPARNFVWEKAVEMGAERHFILDDNIRGFYRFENNTKIPVQRGSAPFRALEDLTDRYENVAESGFQYYMFCPSRVKRAAVSLNCRIYSAILLKTDLPYRWRGVYNEDTDLSIRILKDGWCTLLSNAFLANKLATMSMKGGNTEQLYADNEYGDADRANDGRLKMAQSLVDQHPDIAKISWKWGRYQHEVDYSAFRNNRLILKPGVVISQGVNNYGLRLEKKNDLGVWEVAERP